MAGEIQTVVYELQVTPKTAAADAALDKLGKKAGEIGKGSAVDVQFHADESSLTAAGAKLDELKTKAHAAGAGVAEGLKSEPIKQGLIEKLEADLRTFTEQKRKAMSPAEVQQFNEKISETRAALAKVDESMKKTAGESKGLFGSLKEGLGGALAGGTAIAGAAGGIALMDRMVEAGKEEIAMWAQMKSAFQGNEVAAEAAKKGAEDLSKQYRIDASDIAAATTAFVNMGGPIDNIKAKQEAILGLSKKTGLDMSSAAQLLAKTLTSPTNALSRYGINFKKGATEAEKFASISAGLKGPLGALTEESHSSALGMAHFQLSMKEFMETGGKAILTVLAPLGEGLSEVTDLVSGGIEMFGALPGPVKAVAAGLAILVGGIVAYNAVENISFLNTAAATAAQIAQGVASTGLSIAQKAAALATEGWAVAQKLLNAAFVSSPIGWIVLAIGALVLAVKTAYDHSETFRNAVQALWTWIKQLGSYIADVFVKAVTWLWGEIKKLGEIIWSGIEFWAKWLNVIGLLYQGFKYLYNNVEIVRKTIDALIDEVKGAWTWLKHLVGATDDAAASTKKSGDITAAQTQLLKDQTDQTEKLTAALAEEQKQRDDNDKKQIDSAKTNLIALQEQEAFYEAVLKSSTASAKAKDIARANLEYTKNLIQEWTAFGRKAVGDQKALAAEGAAAAAMIGAGDPKKTKSAYDIAIADLGKFTKDRASKTLTAQNQLQKTATEQYLAGLRKSAELTKEEQARVAEAELADKKAELQKLLAVTKTTLDSAGGVSHIGIKVSDKDAADLKSKVAAMTKGINDAQLNLLKIKPVLDSSAASKALEDAEIALAKKEIEIGLRPKTDILNVIQEQITNAQRALDADKLKLQIAIQSNSSSAAIDAIQTSIANDTAGLEDLQNQLKVTDQGFLDADAARIKKEREASDKLYQDKLAAAQSYTDKVISLAEAAAQKQERISAQEFADKENSYRLDQQSLLRSYQKGEIDSRTYQTKLALLTKERTDFERSQNQGAASAFGKFTKSAYDEASAAGKKWLIDFIKQKAAELLVHITTEDEKTTATTGGSIVRIASDAAEAAASLAVAAAKGVAAAAAAVYNAIASLPFPIDLVAGAASAAAVIGLVGGLTGAIKFETGGLGLTGEKGPEIIGPTKDFSQFATQLVMATAQEVRTAMSGGVSSGGNSSRGRQRPIALQVKRFGIPGRDLNFTLAKDNLIKQTEQVAVVAG